MRKANMSRGQFFGFLTTSLMPRLYDKTKMFKIHTGLQGKTIVSQGYSSLIFQSNPVGAIIFML
jgi:hypothetical protein